MLMTPDYRPAQPLRVVAEGDEEVAQLLRRMTADAWPVAGGVILVAGPEVWPLVWVTAAGRQAVTDLHRGQHTVGHPTPARTIRTAWDCSRPDAGPARSIARLNIWATRSDGQEQPLNLWWDARRHHALLAAIVRMQRLLLFAEKPAPGTLHPLGGQPLPPGVVLQFDTPLAELAALLAGLRGGQAPA